MRSYSNNLCENQSPTNAVASTAEPRVLLWSITVLISHALLAHVSARDPFPLPPKNAPP